MMNKKIQKLAGICLAILLLCSTATVVFAAELTPDYSRKGSISVTVKDTGTKRPIAGGTLTLYTVAKLEDGQEVYTGGFAACTLPLKRLSSPALAKGLETFAKTKKLKGITVRIGDNGKVQFSNLPLGLYLIVQEEAAKDYAPLESFLVTVPVTEDDKLVYDVDATPKAGTATSPTDPTKPTEPTKPTKPTEPTKPTTGGGSGGKAYQTGHTLWPIIVLGALGSSFVLIGKKQINDAEE